MQENSEAFVAFDVAKKKHAVAIAEAGRTGEVRFLGEVRIVRRRSSGRSRSWKKGMIDCTSASKAGPTGYGLCRQVHDLGDDCMVVAPA